MLINENIIEELYDSAGSTRASKAEKYKNQKKVKFIKIRYEDENNVELQAEVQGTKNYGTYIDIEQGEIQNIECDCPDYYNTYGVCKHTLATVLEFSENGYNYIEEKNISQIKNNYKYNRFSQIVKTLYNEELEEIDLGEEEVKNKGTLKIEPKLIYDKYTREMKIEFKIGNKRMYKLKNLAEFYKRMIDKEFYKYGDKLE